MKKIKQFIIKLFKIFFEFFRKKKKFNPDDNYPLW